MKKSMMAVAALLTVLAAPVLSVAYANDTGASCTSCKSCKGCNSDKGCHGCKSCGEKKSCSGCSGKE